MNVLPWKPEEEGVPRGRECKMDNVKCHVREVGWGGQESEGSKLEPTGLGLGVAWKPTVDSEVTALTLAAWLCDLCKEFAPSVLLLPPR